MSELATIAKSKKELPNEDRLRLTLKELEDRVSSYQQEMVQGCSGWPLYVFVFVGSLRLDFPCK
jgi:hypothetical protein